MKKSIKREQNERVRYAEREIFSPMGKKITMTLMVLAITLTASAQTTVDDLIAKLLKTYPKTPSREMVDKDPATGKMLRHITEYSFRDIKPKKFTPLISALRNSQNGYFVQENTLDGGYVYELRVADTAPNFRTVYILQTKGNDADLHVLYGKMPYSEMSTNFEYALGKYYALVNKSTGAKLGMSFDYNYHASAFRDSVPSGRGPNGIGPNGIVITAKKVFRFKFIPTVVVDTRFSDTVSEDCFIVTEDMFALEDGSETTEGQWLMFRYLDKSNPYQRWKLIEKDGTVTIINKATGRCVDLAGGETKEGASIFSYDINDDPQSNANQKWIIEETE